MMEFESHLSPSVKDYNNTDNLTVSSKGTNTTLPNQSSLKIYFYIIVTGSDSMIYCKNGHFAQ